MDVGSLGAVLSVPLLGVGKIICENTPGLKSIAKIMEDAPDHMTEEANHESLDALPHRRPTSCSGRSAVRNHVRHSASSSTTTRIRDRVP